MTEQYNTVTRVRDTVADFRRAQSRLQKIASLALKVGDLREATRYQYAALTVSASIAQTVANGMARKANESLPEQDFDFANVDDLIHAQMYNLEGENAPQSNGKVDPLIETVRQS